jgi:hypothetical protein
MLSSNARSNNLNTCQNNIISKPCLTQHNCKNHKIELRWVGGYEPDAGAPVYFYIQKFLGALWYWDRPSNPNPRVIFVVTLVDYPSQV